jgi:hypothetical protein
MSQMRLPDTDGTAMAGEAGALVCANADWASMQAMNMGNVKW